MCHVPQKSLNIAAFACPLVPVTPVVLELESRVWSDFSVYLLK